MERQDKSPFGERRHKSPALILIDSMGLVVRIIFLPLTIAIKIIQALNEYKKDGIAVDGLDVLSRNCSSSKKNPFSKN